MSLAGSRARVLAGKIITFSAYVKQVSASKFNCVGVGVSCLADKKWYKSSVSTGKTDAGEWQLLQCRLKIPENVTLIFFNLNCAGGWGNTGEAYFDDLHVTVSDKEIEESKPAGVKKLRRHRY